HNVDETVGKLPHITVVYLGKPPKEELAGHIERARQAAAAMPGPLSGHLGGQGTFKPSEASDGKVPVYVPVHLPGIEKLRGHLADLSASEHGGYVPHVTQRYAEPGEPLPPPHPTVPVMFTHLTVHRGGEELARFPLGGQLEKQAAWQQEVNHPGDEEHRLYLRFGDWHPGERSRNYVTGHPEDGVSVYDLDHHGNPIDPDAGLDRWHEHGEHCEPGCDLDQWNEDYGNDTAEEMRGRIQRAEKDRRRGEEHPANTAHLVRGEFAAVGHDGEPCLQKVHRVGDWMDHRHLFIPGAAPHPLARDKDDPDYEAPEGLEKTAGEELVDIYHHTYPSSARAIWADKHFEPDDEENRVYGTNIPPGEKGATGADYGISAVHLRIPRRLVNQWPSMPGQHEHYYDVDADDIEPHHFVKTINEDAEDPEE